MPEIRREKFIENVVEKVNRNSLIVFLGAGIGKEVGLPNWEELIHEIVDLIDINENEIKDLLSHFSLVEIAQFIVNSKKRGDLINKIDELLKIDTEKLGRNIKSITNLPITEFWTTNYDEMIEKGIELNWNKKPNVYHKPEDFICLKSWDKNVYKMHGSIAGRDIIIATEDYMGYRKSKEIFWNKLGLELTHKTCIFIGTSLNDYNLNYILNGVNDLIDKELKTNHYIIFKKEKDGTILSKALSYKIEDLWRFNIYVLLVDDYSEIADIFDEINKKLYLKNIFISGAKVESQNSGFTSNDELDEFIKELSYSLVKENKKIFTGYGVGVGDLVVSGAMSAIQEKNINQDDALYISPFPQQIKCREDRIKIWKQNREFMLSKCGIHIIISGNKNEDGKVVLSEGIINQEFEISKKYANIVIPIPKTGYAAEEVFKIIEKDINNFSYLKEDIKNLSEAKDVNDILNIIKNLSK